MKTTVENVIAVITDVLTTVIISFLLCWFVMLLWNWLMPMIFGLMVLTYWQAFGLTILCELLFQSTSVNKK